MPIYSDVVASASIGATANTFDALGTITLRSDAKRLFGFWVEAALATSTAAEAVHGMMRVNSGDLGIGAQVYPIPPYGGGAPATNIDFRQHLAEFCPMNVPVNGKDKLDIEISTQLPDGTGALSVVVAAIYEAYTEEKFALKGELQREILAKWPEMSPVGRGCQTAAAAAVTTVAETAMTALKIPGWVRELVGCKQYMVPDLMTAGEEIVGYVTYKSTMPNFDPQKWPFGVAFSAPLGTPVGKGAVAPWIPAMGMYFPTTGKSEEVQGFVNMNVAITTGNPVSGAIYFR